MRISCAPLVAIAGRHEFFADGIARSLRFAPTPACAAQLQRRGWLWRAERGGGVVLGPAGAPARARLAFAARFEDAAFLGYTAEDRRAGEIRL